MPQGVAKVMANVPRTHQQGRWLPLPIHRPKSTATTPSTTDIAEYQPSPIPATNGRTPTVIGRTMTMFSPAKAITAGAIVFALGGAFLIAQPFQQQGSVPGTETEAIDPTWVTGSITLASSCFTPVGEFDGPVMHERSYVCDPQTWTASDPRLSGEVAAVWNNDVYQTDNGAIAVNVDARYLRNDGGGWTCSTTNLLKGTGLFSDSFTGTTYTCIGQDGYDGLSAVLVETDDPPRHPFVGLIFSGDLPPLPEPPAAE